MNQREAVSAVAYMMIGIAIFFGLIFTAMLLGWIM
jgi:hypothetical protein